MDNKSFFTYKILLERSEGLSVQLHGTGSSVVQRCLCWEVLIRSLPPCAPLTAGDPGCQGWMHTWTFPKCSKGHLPGPPLGSPVSPLKVEVGALECTLCLASLNGLRTALRVSWKEILKISTFKALNILLRCRISLFFLKFKIWTLQSTYFIQAKKTILKRYLVGRASLLQAAQVWTVCWDLLLFIF